MSKSTKILNAFRNKYYTDGNNTENGVVANAIDEILPEYIKLKKNESKRGKWIFYSDMCDKKCDTCGKFSREVTDYCPHCGARMDGDE